MHNVNTVLLAIIQNVQCKYCNVNTVLYYWQSYRMHNVNTVLLAIIHNVNTVLLAIIQNAQCKYCTTGNHTE